MLSDAFAEELSHNRVASEGADYQSVTTESSPGGSDFRRSFPSTFVLDIDEDREFCPGGSQLKRGG